MWGFFSSAPADLATTAADLATTGVAFLESTVVRATVLLSIAFVLTLALRRAAAAARPSLCPPAVPLHVAYVFDDDIVSIIAVAHHRRDPASWENRR